MRISDWSSDVCSSDLGARVEADARPERAEPLRAHGGRSGNQLHQPPVAAPGASRGRSETEATLRLRSRPDRADHTAARGGSAEARSLPIREHDGDATHENIQPAQPLWDHAAGRAHPRGEKTTRKEARGR